MERKSLSAHFAPCKKTKKGLLALLHAWLFFLAVRATGHDELKYAFYNQQGCEKLHPLVKPACPLWPGHYVNEYKCSYCYLFNSVAAATYTIRTSSSTHTQHLF